MSLTSTSFSSSSLSAFIFIETASQTTTQIQQKPDSIQPEVLLFGFEKKRRPRIKDQNREQEIARLGF